MIKVGSIVTESSHNYSFRCSFGSFIERLLDKKYPKILGDVS